MGGGRYGVNILSNYYSKEKSSLVSVKDALQLMLTFGTFTIGQILKSTLLGVLFVVYQS